MNVCKGAIDHWDVIDATKNILDGRLDEYEIGGAH